MIDKSKTNYLKNLEIDLLILFLVLIKIVIILQQKLFLINIPLIALLQKQK